MTVGRICTCKAIVMPGQTHACAPSRERAAADNARRHDRQRAHGRDTRRWRQLRELALERDGGLCQLRADAGCTVAATTVHLRADLNGDHDAATLDDVESACAHCHGVTDAPRSQGGWGSRDFSTARPAPGCAPILESHAEIGWASSGGARAASVDDAVAVQTRSNAVRRSRA